MTETEQKIVDVLRQHGSLTLCEMYEYLDVDAGNCELDLPLLVLEKRGVIRDSGMRQCKWGRNRVFSLMRDQDKVKRCIGRIAAETLSRAGHN